MSSSAAAAPAQAVPVSVSLPEDEIPECCRFGFLDTGTATGSETIIGGINTYIVKPAELSDKAIVLFSDIFGWQFLNSRLVADAYAKETGFNVYLPDLMGGKSPGYEPLSAFFEKGKSTWNSITRPFRMIKAVGIAVGFMATIGDAKVVPIWEAFHAGLVDPNGSEKIKKIAAIGFCWGARFVAIAAVAKQIDVIGMAHPSRVQVPEHVEQFTQPSIWLCAENDRMFSYPALVNQTKEILTKNNVINEFRVYPGTDHGFAIRGDPEDKVYAKAKSDATTEAIKFFKQHL